MSIHRKTLYEHKVTLLEHRTRIFLLTNCFIYDTLYRMRCRARKHCVSGMCKLTLQPQTFTISLNETIFRRKRLRVLHLTRLILRIKVRRFEKSRNGMKFGRKANGLRHLTRPILRTEVGNRVGGSFHFRSLKICKWNDFLP